MRKPTDPQVNVRASLFSDGCQEEGCLGLGEDGTCPNGYGVTCSSLFPEPTNMDDDPLLKATDE